MTITGGELVRPGLRSRGEQHPRCHVVDPFGRIVEVSATQHPDLFWAIRGGGGDFGIILTLDIALHPGGDVFGGRILWPVEEMEAVLRAFRAVTDTAPDTLTAWYHTYQFPPDPAMPEFLRGKAFASVAVAYLATRPRATSSLARSRRVPGVVMDSSAVLMAELRTIADEPTEPTPFPDHSLFLNDLSDDTIEAFVGVARPGSRSALALLQIRHLGGVRPVQRE